MIVEYLKTEITTRIGAHGEETAFATIDGDLRCFLGGLPEAKRFLRERKAGPHYGPRAASWSVTLSDSGCVSVYGAREHAVDTVAYFRAQGRTPTLTRTETCTYPGCDGHGDVNERGRRGHYVSRPCPQHLEPVETIEEV